MRDSSPRQPLDYARGECLIESRRSVRKWTILLLTWLVGLGVWAFYIAAITYLFFRFLA